MTITTYRGYNVHDDGWVEQKRSPGLYLLPEIVKGGYLRVTLKSAEGTRKVLLHVLVAELFIGPKPAGSEVNHKDGDKGNNAVANLEYVTPRENVRHSLDVLGVQRAKGSRNSQARLTETAVRHLRRRHADGESAASLASEFGLHVSTVFRAINGQRWGHVA